MNSTLNQQHLHDFSIENGIFKSYLKANLT